MPTPSDNDAAINTEGMALPERVIEHVRLTDSALQKAAAFEQATNEKQAQCAALIPQVVETLVKHERIQPGQAEKCAEMLKDPAVVLDLMMKVAGHRNRDESKLGEGVKQASASGSAHDPAKSLTTPFVGQRTAHEKQSSVNFFKGLGLQAPTEA